MASKTSPADDEGPMIDMADYGAKLAAGQAELGYPELAQFRREPDGVEEGFYVVRAALTR